MEIFGMEDVWYVWTAYLLTVLVFVLNEWRARVRHRTVYRDVEVRIKAIEERM